MTALAAIVTAVRQRCPRARITVRGDGGFCREELMAWCEAHGVYYVLGLARNARLLELVTPALVRARERAVLCGGHTREFADLKYRTLDSWSREPRVIGKAEILGDKDNPRFIVTNLPAETHAAAPLYEQVYCGRGGMENAIKEHQLDLFGERLSCHGFASNEVRLLLASFAQLLLERLRTIGLAGTTAARASGCPHAVLGRGVVGFGCDHGPQGSVFGVSRDVGYRQSPGIAPAIGGGSGKMRGQEYVVQPAQGRISRKRFDGENIQAEKDASLPRDPEQGSLVDHGRPADIHKHAAGPDESQMFFQNDIHRAGAQRRKFDDDVALREQRLQ